jgi:DNA repair photolyase
MGLVRDTRGGKTYQSGFGRRMRGTGTYAELLERRFELAVGRLGLNGRPDELDTGRFLPPPAAGDQLDLFG